MARKNDSPQKAAMREMLRDYLKNNDISIKNETDVNVVMRDMMSVLLVGALKGIYKKHTNNLPQYDSCGH